MKSNLLSLIVLFLFSLYSFAQNTIEKCGTDRLLRQAYQNPETVARMQAAEHHTQQWVNQHQNELRAPQEVLTIPVVVHVVWYSGNPESNISDAQINSQIAEMNRVYRRQNANASQTRAIFLDVAADAEVEFCLAQRDPNGFPTTGITRTVTDSSTFYTDAMKRNITGGKDAWPTNDYLNIWVCNRLRDGQVLGYAFIPGQAPNPQVDGLAIDYDYFGTTGTVSPPYNIGRTAAHEIGHWLGLYHPWATGNDAGNCTDDDFVTDTPQTSDPNFACLFSINSCGAGTPGDQPDMVENYMDYATDVCQNIFTLGQKARMRSTLSFGGYHYSVTQNAIACQPVEQGPNDAVLLAVLEPSGPGNCTTVAPVLQIQNFGTQTLAYLVIEYSVDGGTTQSYEWVGSLASLDTMNITLPNINTTASGIVHTININVTLPNASPDFNTINNTKVVTFATIAVGAALPIQQDFAAASLPAGYTTINADNATTWAINNQTVYMHNFNYNTTNTIDELKLPKLNFATVGFASLTFDVAYALKASGNESDILEVLASKNCEETYEVVGTFTANDLVTASPINAEFTPSTTDWQTKTVNLNNYVGAQNVFIKFKQTRKQGNNLFLDNLNITGPTVGIDEPKPMASKLGLYPNPAQGQLNLAIRSNNTEQATITIYNNMGQVVSSQNTNLLTGNNSIAMSIGNLPNGIYFVQIQSANLQATQKLFVAR